MTSSSSTTVENVCFHPPAAGNIVAPVTLIPLSVIGIFTNVVTISVILWSPRLKTTFNYLIASLAMSDLTSAIISSLFLYRITWGFMHWEWGEFPCKLFWAMDILTSYVTSSHILLFSFLRFMSVQWPVRFRCLKNIHAKVAVVVIWFVTALVGAVPFGIWFAPKERCKSGNKKWPACSLDEDWEDQFIWYTRIAYPIFFYIPIILISIFSVLLALKIHRRRQKRRLMINTGNAEARRKRKENNMMLQLGLIVGSFLIGYITYSIYHLTTVLSDDVSLDEFQVDWWFGFIEYLMLRISECLNPIFYNLASNVMRQETKRMLTQAWERVTCSEHTENTDSRCAPTVPDDEFNIE